MAYPFEVQSGYKASELHLMEKFQVEKEYFRHLPVLIYADSLLLDTLRFTTVVVHSIAQFHVHVSAFGYSSACRCNQ